MKLQNQAEMTWSFSFSEKSNKKCGEDLQTASHSAETANVLMNVSEFDSIDEATESLISMSAAYDDLDKMDIVDKLNLVGLLNVSPNLW